ncbi:MAG: hypothetical protein M1404_03715 [Acidobacteria bacterium]|nr:hypothetical protein [Acidobacteriota bacterium]
MAVAIGKIDALLFAVGILAGIFLFGVTVPHITSFNLSGHLGTLTIPTWLNLNTGIVVLAVVVLAIVAFWAAEKSEGPWNVFARLYGKQSKGDERR